MNTKLKPLTLAILFASPAVFATELETITINADLRESSEQDIAASVNVKTQADLQDQGASHFDDVLLKTPNVNFSGQSSRARHIQIRGLGEREDYTGALNARVGFAIDGIDYSGNGMAASTFDIQQIEVLRGPQNTTFGQSAIAGIINVESNDPTPYRESMIEATGGQDSLTELGIMTSGPFSDKDKAPQYRFSLFKHDSDGFRDNKTLNRDDTNSRDELTARAKLRFFPSDATTVDVTLLHADLDNGYDAWSPTNTFTTLSNAPGQDFLKTNSASLKIVSNENPFFTFTSSTSISDFDTIYSYDDDWYDYDWGTFYNQTAKQNINQEFRFSSTPKSQINGNIDWLSGVYLSDLDSESQTDYAYDTNNKYNLKKVAGYGQFDIHTDNKTTITVGGRIENSSADFSNQDNEVFNPSETLYGFNLAYSYQYNDINTAYTSLIRGYKASGFNADQPDNSVSPLSYSAETLYNFEMGLKTQTKNFSSRIAMFYMDRKNPQFDGSLFRCIDENCFVYNWYYYTENLESAKNYGLEAEFDWQATSQLNIYGALGLLKTTVEGTPLNSELVMSGREQAHAPNYQANLGVKYRSVTGFYSQADVTALDSFYYDNINDQKTDSYVLLNARIGYETEDYEVYLWAKNLTDETYATRGFYFDLDWDGQNDEFIRLGDPRQLGITGRVYF